MNILVCMSVVPDTTTKIKFKDSNTQFDDAGVQWIINPWDELALTRALELKEDENSGVEKVTVVNVGEASAEATIRKALAVGADNAVRVDAFPQDAYFVAQQLAQVVQKDNYDIILAGIESSDYNNSAVGGMLAEMTGLPSVSSVTHLDVNNKAINLQREIAGGKETVEVATPFVGIVQKGIALDPRIPAMRGIMQARKKPLQKLEAVEGQAETKVSSYAYPPAKGDCTFIDPGNEEELFRRLKEEAKVI